MFYIIAEYQGGYNKTIVLSTLQVLSNKSTTTLVISILGDAQSGIHSSTCRLEQVKVHAVVALC